jgi:heavy metal efflux system protein
MPPLPNGVVAQISPESPIGEIYRYRVVGPPGYSVMDLKTIQDWILERRFKAVPGVIYVVGWGGKTKNYEVIVDQNKLLACGVTIPQIQQALNNANINVGGQTVSLGPQSVVVRGVGLIQTMDDIRDTMVSQNNGSPIRIKDIATVQIGNQPRLGIAGQDNDGDMVKGIVLMRRGAKSLPTLRGVEAEVQKINSTGILPPGVRLEKLYDRSDLIAITTQTVLHNLVAGVVLIFVIQWIFLGNLRSAIVVATTIPFALFFAIIIMQLQGESANLLSVGAIDFGLIVDATVIMAENIYRHLIISYFNRLVEGDLDRSAALLQACQMRLRPVMMTCVAACVGLLPAAVSNGIGAQVQKPLALVVVGGSLLAPGLILIILPVLIDVFSRRGRRTTPSAAPTPEPVR